MIKETESGVAVELNIERFKVKGEYKRRRRANKFLYLVVMVIIIFSLLFVTVSIASDCSDEAGIWLNRGISLFETGNFKESIKSCDKAIELDHDCSDAWNTRGNSLSMLGRYEEAYKSFDMAIKLNPEKKAIFLNNKGGAFERAGNYTAAIEAFEKCIELGFDAWANRAVTYEKNGEHEKAINVAREAVKVSPATSSDAFLKIGDILRDQGKFEDALNSYNQAIEADPSNSNAWSSKGNALADLGEYNQSLTAHNKAVELDPQSAFAWVNKGFVLHKLGKLDEALESFDKSIEIDSNIQMAWNNKGYLLELLGRHEEALEALDKAAQLSLQRQTLPRDLLYSWNLFLESDPELSKIMDTPTAEIGKMCPLLVELTALDDIKDDINLITKYVYIDFLEEGHISPESVIVDGDMYTGTSYEVRVKDKIKKEKLTKGEKETLKINLSFQNPGIYQIKVRLDEPNKYKTIYVMDPETAKKTRELKTEKIFKYTEIIMAFVAGVIIPLAIIYLSKKIEKKRKS
jgi:tetratricopeptide (TPR) repeat protein